MTPGRWSSNCARGIVDRGPLVTLSGAVECDGVYVVAGHKGHPEAVENKGGSGDADA
jgi:hypothetical protein